MFKDDKHWQHLKMGEPFKVLYYLHLCSLHSHYIAVFFTGTECGRDEANIEHHSKLDPEKG